MPGHHNVIPAITVKTTDIPHRPAYINHHFPRNAFISPQIKPRQAAMATIKNKPVISKLIANHILPPQNSKIYPTNHIIS